MKLFACAVIVAAGWLLGGMAAESKRAAYYQARGILRLLAALRAGIDYARTDLFSAFARFSDKYLEECGFISALNSGAVSAEKAWNAACDTLSPNVPMLAEIRSIGPMLGMSDAQTQTELISKLALRLEPRVEESGRELRAKASNYRILGALMGCMAAIIIY
ncbi:MAG: stage III sporulation protein AB [Clostridia bacterium]|nr:stage III sporulation protein AB [Clostridia bacterium]